MLLRNLERTPVRSALSSLGIAFAMAVLVLGLFMFDVIERMADLQFRITQRDDIAVAFRGIVPEAAGHDLARIEGVSRAEPFRTTVVRLRNAQHVRTVAVSGRRTDDVLRRLVDMDGRIYALPPVGVVLGASVADALGVRAGDTVRAELLERGNRTVHLVVAATIEEMIGATAYMEAGELARLLREAPAASGVLLSVDAAAERDVFDALKRIPAVAGASSRRAQLESFQSQVSETLLISATITILFAALIAVGVIYNGARISLSERGRELASLRVLGFTKAEVTRLLLSEQALLTGFALPVGSLIGIGFSLLIVRAIQTDMFRMLFYLRPESLIIAALIVVAVAALTGLALRRRVHRLDLVSVLKTRE
jgi:putative ABC transport system permease protein